MNKKIIQLTESNLRHMIIESVNRMLNESQESSSQKEAKNLVQQRFGWDRERVDKFVREELRNNITALRDKKIAKFTLGVTRMYCDGQIRDAKTISALNATLSLMLPHINEYDRNLNGLSSNELIDRFKQVRQDNTNQKREELNNTQFGESTYNIIPINSFDEAQKYYRYTNPESPWCLTHMEDMYDSYTCDGINQIYFCLKNGFENIEPIAGENTPLDEYGLSMISVIVNEEGELAYCTSRWNHDNGGNDSIMNETQLSHVLNMNFYNVFKPNNKWNDLVSSCLERLRNGENPKNVFDVVNNFKEGFARVKLNKKWNYISTEGKLLTDQWFDEVYSFKEGFARVYLYNKGYNFMNTKGELLTHQWFDDAENFNGGFAHVCLDGMKWYYINTYGELLINQ